GVVAASGNPAFDSESMVFDYALQGNLQLAQASASGHLYLGDTDHPLGGAEVVLSNSSGAASGGVSNPDGSFVVTGLPAGTYDVAVAGYFLAQPLQVTVPASGGASGLAIVARSGGSISGTVFKATDGRAVGGTRVIATKSDDDSVYQVVTAADGTYTL